MFGSSVRKRSPDKGLFSKEGKERELLSQVHTILRTYICTYLNIYCTFNNIIYLIISVVVPGNQLSVSGINCGRADGNRVPWGRRLGLSLGKLSLGSL